MDKETIKRLKAVDARIANGERKEDAYRSEGFKHGSYYNARAILEGKKPYWARKKDRSIKKKAKAPSVISIPPSSGKIAVFIGSPDEVAQAVRSLL